MALSGLNLDRHDEDFQDTGQTEPGPDDTYVLTLDEISNLAHDGGKPAATLMNVVGLIAVGGGVRRTEWFCDWGGTDAGARSGRLAEQSAQAAGGVRHEWTESGAERRTQPVGAGWLGDSAVLPARSGWTTFFAQRPVQVFLRPGYRARPCSSA